MASRVVYSHLTSLELRELVANNLTHYVQLAVKYYKNRDSLFEMRAAILEAKQGTLQIHGSLYKILWRVYKLFGKDMRAACNLIIMIYHRI